MKTIAAILIAVLLALPASLRASLFQDTLKINLEKVPALYSYLITSIDFREREWGNVQPIPVDSSVPSKGYRAIWTFEAKPKGHKDGYPLQVKIVILTSFYDANGNPTDSTNATQAKRSVEGVTLIETNNKEYRASRPDPSPFETSGMGTLAKNMKPTHRHL